MKKKTMKVKAWAISHRGYPCLDLVSNGDRLGGVWVSKKLALAIAKDWSDATDDPHEVIPVTILFTPKKV